MRLTYYGKKQGREFSVNSAGAKCLAILHANCWAELMKPISEDDETWPHRVQYVTNEYQCHDAAQAIKSDLLAGAKGIVAAFVKCRDFGLFSDNQSEFFEWVSGWVTFLNNCGGYDTDP